LSALYREKYDMDIKAPLNCTKGIAKKSQQKK
jgi:hypothetical protein